MTQPFLALSASVGWVCLALVVCPPNGHAQQNQAGRGRAAARALPSPSASPKPTPTIIPAAPRDPELDEPSPPSDAVDDAPVTETEIDATEGATFASKDRIAVFKGHVRVTDPRFQLACDTLTVFLNKTTSADAPAVPAAVGSPAPKPVAGAASTPPPLAAGNTPPPPSGTPAAKADPNSGGGGIDHAVAEGHVIILQKRAPTKPGEEEKVSIGRGEKGTFDNKTGDMVLYGLPEIEQNGNSHTATSPTTVMTIHKDSSLDTVGPSTTKLIQHKGSGNAGIELPGVPAGQAGTPKPKKNGGGLHPQSSPAAASTPAR